MAREALKEITDPEKIYDLIPDASQSYAKQLHELGKRLCLLVEPRTSSVQYKVQYSVPKPKRSIFTIEVKNGKWQVKSSLQNMHAYESVAEQSDAAILEKIRKTRTCNSCNDRCKKGSKFRLFDMPYNACIGSGHYFSDLNDRSVQDLMKLISLEVSCN